MSDTIKNYHQLDQYAAAAARDIVDEIKKHGGEAHDMAREHANGCEYVIYYHHAHAICQNCDTENSEAFIEECGGFGENVTYDSIAVKIACAELHHRILHALHKMGVVA